MAATPALGLRQQGIERFNQGGRIHAKGRCVAPIVVLFDPHTGLSAGIDIEQEDVGAAWTSRQYHALR